MEKKLIYLIVAMMAITCVFAASTIETDRLNYWGSKTHTVTVCNDEGSAQNVNVDMPTGFNFGSSGSCTNPSGQLVTCSNVADGSCVSWTMTSPSSGVNEYESRTMNGTIGTTALDDINFVKIQDSEVFLTLVEYGRGKSCYFYSSEGLAGSGQDQLGYPYIPSGEDFELNWLHKIYPTSNNYLGVPTAEGSGISFSCTYPNQTVTKEHLISSLSIGSEAQADFSADLLTNSWERVFWITQGYDSGEYVNGNNITVNCTAITYQLPEAHGNVSIDENSFVMTFATKEPISMAVSSTTANLCNGTSEVEITYTFTNNGPYPLSTGKDAMTIEIQSPDHAEFIGTRGELWGTSQENYLYEIQSLDAGESIEITLVARFDTSSTSDDPILLTNGATASFVPTWQLNCYNPMSLTQSFTPNDNLSVNYGTDCSVVDVQDTVDNIWNSLTFINETIININDTTTDILFYVEDINSTVTEINNIVIEINGTTHDINNTVTLIKNDTETVINLLDCDGSSDTPICQYVLDINSTVTTIETNTDEIITYVNEINQTTWQTYNDMQANFTEVWNRFDELQTNISTMFTDIDELKQYLNCTIDSNDSVCYRLGLLENYSLEINSTTHDNYELLLYINNTALPEMESRLNASIWESQVDIDNLTTQIRQLREFEEESIYLITDSMVESQQQAMEAFEEGDLVTTAKKADETRELINRLRTEIDKIQPETQREPIITAVASSKPGIFEQFLIDLQNLLRGLF